MHANEKALFTLQVQSSFYRNVAAPLFEEWHRAVNTPLSANMLSNLSSNQARWDLICQQEARPAGMAESVVSTSSSSGGGGSLSRRGSLEPPPNPHHRLSRSSGDGDDDSEDQSSFPYMPLDSVEAGFNPTFLREPLTSPRRHSLPFPEEMPAGIEPVSLEVSLQRQLSLIDSKKRTTALQELRKQNNDLLASLRTSKKRRVFKKANSSAVAESTLTSADKTKVTFHLSNSVDTQSTQEVTEMTGNPEKSVNLLKVTGSHCYHNNQRRGSAPCTLLLNQINKIATSASKAASTASREHSPRGHCFNRRNSLPSQDGDSLLIEATASLLTNKRKRKLMRRKSVGAGDGVSGSGDGVILTTKRGTKTPSLGKRGSLRSSSFGGVGVSPPSVKPSYGLHNGRLSWHGKQAPVGGSHHLGGPNGGLKILEEAIHDVNGRRGSLPCELILC